MPECFDPEDSSQNILTRQSCNPAQLLRFLLSEKPAITCAIIYLFIVDIFNYHGSCFQKSQQSRVLSCSRWPFLAFCFTRLLSAIGNFPFPFLIIILLFLFHTFYKLTTCATLITMLKLKCPVSIPSQP